MKRKKGGQETFFVHSLLLTPYSLHFTVVFLVLVLTVLAPPLLAQESYREFERGLNLSESQRSQIDGIKRKYMGEWMSLKNESARKRLELREMDRERPGERERAERIERELQDLHTSRQRLFRQYQGEVSGILNDEQRSRYNAFVNRERKRPMNMPRYGPMHPPGRMDNPPSVVGPVRPSGPADHHAPAFRTPSPPPAPGPSNPGDYRRGYGGPNGYGPSGHGSMGRQGNGNRMHGR